MKKRTTWFYIVIGVLFIYISVREINNDLDGTLIFFGIGGLALLLNGVKGLVRVKD